MVWSSCNCVKINKPIFVDGIHDLSNDAFHYVRFEHCVVTAHASLHISMNFSGRIRCVGFWNRKPSVRVCFIFFLFIPMLLYWLFNRSTQRKREEKKICIFFSSVAGQVSFVIHWHCYCWFYYKPTKLIRLHICIYSIAMHPSVKENQELEKIKWNGKNNIRTHQWQ